MKLSDADKKLLSELCTQYHVSMDKVLSLLSTVRDYELKDRRVGIYEALRDIIAHDVEGA
jgi:hypothetical protein